MLEWYLHTKKQLPDDPLNIARQCNYGQDQLAKVNYLAEEDHNKADQETGRPAFYDNAIPTEGQVLGSGVSVFESGVSFMAVV